MCSDIKLPCCKIVDGAIDKESHEMVPLNDIVLIDLLDVSKHDRRIRVRTIDGDYVFKLTGPLSVMEEMLTDFGFWRSDTKNLINMQHVDKVEKTLFAAEVVFKGTDMRGMIAKIKLKSLREVFPDVQIIRGGLL